MIIMVATKQIILSPLMQVTRRSKNDRPFEASPSSFPAYLRSLFCQQSASLKNCVRLGRKDGDACRSTCNCDTQTHGCERPTNIGKEHHNCDRQLARQFCFALNPADEIIKILCNHDRCSKTNWPNDIVENIEASIYGQEWFPLARCQRAKSSLR